MSLKDKKLMPPLWLAYPGIERFSIGWRMGNGESYRYRFCDWFSSLFDEEQAEYQELFPEPIVWKGWWKDEYDSCEVLIHGEYCIELWQSNGKPKYSVSQLKQDENPYLFWGHHPSKDGSITKSCLSQWWKSEFWAVNQTYCCMEQYMMAQKAELFGDKEIRQKILDSTNPKQIKALGRKVRGFDQKLWDKAKYAIVLNGNWCKFSQNRKLRDFLLSTGEHILAEASPYDGIWGIRLSADAPGALNPSKWQGENLLGFALMEVRNELLRVTRNEQLCDWSVVK